MGKRKSKTYRLLAINSQREVFVNAMKCGIPFLEVLICAPAFYDFGVRHSYIKVDDLIAILSESTSKQRQEAIKHIRICVDKLLASAPEISEDQILFTD